MPPPVHVLLVHDASQDGRTRKRLEEAGCRVSEARPGTPCLQALKREQGVTVLLDLAADGRGLLEQLTRAHPDTPVVALSTAADLAAAVDAMQRGAWDYVVLRPDGGHLEDLPRIVAAAQARRAIVDQRNRYREEVEALAEALRGTTDGVVILDNTGRITFVNRALATAWNAPEDAIVGLYLQRFVAVVGSDGTLVDVLDAVAEQGRWTGTLECRTGTPPRPVWEATLTPIGSPAETRAVVGILRDVSDERALQQMRSDLLTMVTHDIKVPLTAILGYTEMLADPEPRSHEVVPHDLPARIRESGEQIHALVCNFLDLSRIEAGCLVLDRRPFDLRTLLAHAVEQQAAGACRKGVVLTLEPGDSLPLVGDRAHLERVVANLLANAIKFTPAGGRVTIAARAGDGAVEVTVRDTGRGIAAADLPRLFEKYRRATEARRTEGTGLGLFISKTIVEAHAGEIRVESTPGAGSTFTVRLPAGAG